jgi:hypothetical protein
MQTVLTEHAEDLYTDLIEYRDGIRAQAVDEEVSNLKKYLSACKSLKITAGREAIDVAAMKTFPDFDGWPAERDALHEELNAERAEAANAAEEHFLAFAAARNKRDHLDREILRVCAEDQEKRVIATLNPFLLGPIEHAAKYLALPALTLQEATGLAGIDRPGQQELAAEKLRNRKLAVIKAADSAPKRVDPNVDLTRLPFKK